MTKTIEFEWDQWNVQKNEVNHGVSVMEAQSVFFDPNYRLFEDINHPSDSEKRYIIFGRSLESRILMAAFTLRGAKVRIITPRPASRKERGIYEKQK